MRISIIGVFAFVSSAYAGGKQPPAPGAAPEVRVTNETLPPGSTVQLKFSLTEPTPITTGTTSANLDSAFDSIDGIQLFSPTGDVFGVAVSQNNKVQVRYVSPNGTFGLATDYPVLTIAAHLRNTTLPGTSIALGANATLNGQSGAQNYSIAVKPGTLTVGGSVSIQNVIPGGGMRAAGSVIRVLGSGFQKNTTIRATVRIASSAVIASNEIDIVLAEAGNLDGARIDVKNPDGSADSYFSYQRGVEQQPGAEPLLNATVPIFSSLTYSQAALTQYSRGVTNSILTGLAIQNPNNQPASIQLEAFSPLGSSIAKVQIVLPFRGKSMRELGEYFGVSLPDNSTVKVSADSPVQFLGVLADKNAGTAAAFAIGR